MTSDSPVPSPEPLDSLAPTETPVDWEQTFDPAPTPTEDNPLPSDVPTPVTAAGDRELAALLAEREALQQELASLQAEKATWYGQQWQELQRAMETLAEESLKGLEQRKASLEKDIERLERRQERIQQEMRTTFAGASQELAIRVQGFKDYLVGSLQDLVSAADQLELGRGDSWESSATYGDSIVENAVPSPAPLEGGGSFGSQKRQIQEILNQYRTRPDYYGPPWQLRRTFEPIHGEQVENWFFTLGGRGAIKGLDSRLQNILVGAAVISVLHALYGDRSRALILAATPERLGEWRRGLQDCLGISRADFGPDRGVVLFESAGALVQRAERLMDDRQMPLILVDETEEQIDLALLQFPLLLAFASRYSYSQGGTYF